MSDRFFDAGIKALFLMGIAGGVVIVWLLVIALIIQITTGANILG